MEKERSGHASLQKERRKTLFLAALLATGCTNAPSVTVFSPMPVPDKTIIQENTSKPPLQVEPDLKQIIGKASVPPSDIARKDIPQKYLKLYLQAEKKYNVTWTVLSAIGKKETDHGRLRMPGVKSGLNNAHCCRGPMQFNTENGKGTKQSTWEEFSKDGDNIYAPEDAIPAAARKLLADGINSKSTKSKDPCPDIQRGSPALHKALKNYNNACWYVNDVINIAVTYGGIKNNV